MYLNKAIIAGNLTRDPDMRSIPSGAKVTTFSVATNRFWKDQSGKNKEATDYHNIVVFGKQAEHCAQYLFKGSGVLVEGRMQTRSWDGNDGQKRYRTEVVADRVQFGQRANSSESAPASKKQTEPLPAKDTPPIKDVEYPDGDISSEDIPF